jgi:hypothetical protein
MKLFKVSGVLVVAVLACNADGSGNSTSTTNDAAPDASTKDALSSFEVDSSAADATASSGSDVVSSNWVPDAALLDAIAPPPRVACEVDASATVDGDAVCASPPSQCAESWWLVYYDNGRCVAGWCMWDTGFVDCGEGSCIVSKVLGSAGCLSPPTQ